MLVQRPLPILALASALAGLSACKSVGQLPSDGSNRDAAQVTATPQPSREGPWRMQCYVEDELVLDVPKVYRVDRETRAGGKVYVTEDGTVIRGRITAGANCVWLPPGENPPLPEKRPDGT